MLQLKEINSNQVAVIEASGKLTKEDYQKVLPDLETALTQYESLNFYIELDGFSGFEIAALKEDLSFDLEHKDHFGKVAVVGERRLEEWATKLSDLAFDAPLRFFEKAESKQAWEWVNGH